MSQQAELHAGVHLNPSIIEAIAQRVAELLRAELGLMARLLTPNEVADQFAVSRTWVYEHADELGAIRLGRGPKARLRFDVETVSQILHRNESSMSEAGKLPGAAGCDKAGSGPPLLPIYGALGGQ